AANPAEARAGLVVFVEHAAIRAGEMRGSGDDRIEDGVEIEARAHGARNLAQHVQLLERARELAGTRLDLVFERRARAGELGRRVIQLVAERFQFVAGGNVDAMVEIAGTDARGASL